jgi:hypothetical protein
LARLRPAPAQGSTAPFAYRILYLRRLKNHIPRPRAEPALRIDRFHLRTQRGALGAILRRVLALDFQHQCPAVAQPDQESRRLAVAPFLGYAAGLPRALQSIIFTGWIQLQGTVEKMVYS